MDRDGHPRSGNQGSPVAVRNKLRTEKPLDTGEPEQDGGPKTDGGRDGGGDRDGSPTGLRQRMLVNLAKTAILVRPTLACPNGQVCDSTAIRASRPIVTTMASATPMSMRHLRGRLCLS